MRNRMILLAFGACLPALAQTPDEIMRHFQALVQIDSTDPPGNETKVAEYVKKVFEAESIPTTLLATFRRKIGISDPA